MIICCIGDSITEGDYGIKGKSGIANVHAENYPYFLSLLAGCEVRNFGKCGWRASNMWKWYREGGVEVKDADIIIVILGANGGHSATEDTPDNQDYASLALQLRKDAPNARIWLCTPLHVTVNPEMSNFGYAPQVNAATLFVRRFAADNQFDLIDLASDPHFTDETEAIMQPNDGIHCTEEGYKTLAQVIYDRIR